MAQVSDRWGRGALTLWALREIDDLADHFEYRAMVSLLRQEVPERAVTIELGHAVVHHGVRVRRGHWADEESRYCWCCGVNFVHETLADAWKDFRMEHAEKWVRDADVPSTHRGRCDAGCGTPLRGEKADLPRDDGRTLELADRFLTQVFDHDDPEHCLALTELLRRAQRTNLEFAVSEWYEMLGTLRMAAQFTNYPRGLNVC